VVPLLIWAQILMSLCRSGVIVDPRYLNELVGVMHLPSVFLRGILALSFSFVSSFRLVQKNMALVLD
jgi:hypothetical protein